MVKPGTEYDKNDVIKNLSVNPSGNKMTWLCFRRVLMAAMPSTSPPSHSYA